MKIIFYYISSLAAGLITIALTIFGSEHFVSFYTESASAAGKTGHPSPMLLIIPLFLIGMTCIIVFVIYNIIYSRFMLAESESRLKHFVLNLLLYLTVVFLIPIAAVYFSKDLLLGNW